MAIKAKTAGRRPAQCKPFEKGLIPNFIFGKLRFPRGNFIMLSINLFLKRTNVRRKKRQGVKPLAGYGQYPMVFRL